MIKKWLYFLLVSMIAVQSLGALPDDEHQSHQDGKQHLEFDHEHDLNAPSKQSGNVKSFSIVEFDCHHCCHCQNLCQFGVLNKSDIFNIALSARIAIEQY